MQVERNVEPLGALVDRPEALVVEKGDAVLQPMHHGTLEPELGDAALELVGGRRRIGGRQRGEGGKPARVCLDGGMEPIVDAAGQIGSDVLRELLGRRRAVREHLDVDPDLVHLLDAQFTEIEQALFRLAPASRLRTGKLLGQFRVPVVFLQRNDRTIWFLEHAGFLLLVRCRVGNGASGGCPRGQNRSCAVPSPLWRLAHADKHGLAILPTLQRRTAPRPDHAIGCRR